MEKPVTPYVATEVALTPSQMKDLNISDPAMVVELARTVASYVKSQDLTVRIQSSDYVMVEGWQFAASLLGLIGKVQSYTNASIYEPITFEWVSFGKAKKHTARGTFKYFAEAVMQNAEGKVIAQGFAMCSNEEVKKHTFDEYAILSMAQTRAIGKAARMALAFLIKAAGFEPTPAEEMDDVEEKEKQAEVTELPEEVELQIYLPTSADDLREWANEQKAYHKNSHFLALVSKQIQKLENEAKRTKKGS